MTSSSRCQKPNRALNVYANHAGQMSLYSGCLIFVHLHNLLSGVRSYRATRPTAEGRILKADGKVVAVLYRFALRQDHVRWTIDLVLSRSAAAIINPPPVRSIHLRALPRKRLAIQLAPSP